MTITRPVSSVTVNPRTTVHSDAPPFPLAPIAADGVTDDSATIQAHLDYVKSTYGGGAVELPPNKIIKCNSGITIPAKVQLRSSLSTIIGFPGLGTGTAITINDNDFVPMVGVRIEGPNWQHERADGSTGLNITGARLQFYDTRIRFFGHGIDLAHIDTYIITFTGGMMGNCGTIVYNDIIASGAYNAGERIVFDSVTFDNSDRALNVTAGGQSFYLTNCSIDFCAEFGYVRDAFVYLTASHLETGGNDAGPWLFDVDANAHMFFSNVNVLMGSDRPGGLYHLFRLDHGPWNFGFGSARFDNVSVYYIDPNGATQARFSEELVAWPANATEVSFYTPFPLKWAPLTAQFAVTNGDTQPVGDNTVRITGANPDTGLITLAATSNAAHRWVRVKCG